MAPIKNKKSVVSQEEVKTPRRAWYMLGGIIAIAVGLRIWQLSKTPPGLYWDEMDAGYQAYSFLHTGRDYFGNLLPIHFHSLADFRAPFYIYATVPFVAALGLTSYAVRLPAVFFGIAIIVLLYFLTKWLTRDWRLGLVASAIVTLAPWHIQYSRMAFEATAMLALFLLGLFAFFKSLTNPKWLFVAAIGFGLSPAAYSTAKFFVPMILLVLLVVYYQDLWQQFKLYRKTYFLAALLFFVLALPLFYTTFFGKGGQRFSEIAIFTDPTLKTEIDHKRLEAAQASGVTVAVGMQTKIINRLTFNKPLYLLDEFTNNYLSAFSTQFLFIEGDPNIRHSPKFYAELYPVEAIALILGITFFVIGKHYRTKRGKLLLAWVFLAPIPAAITRDGAEHATRLFFLYPVLTIFLTYGIGLVFQAPKKTKAVFAIIYGGIWLIGAFFFLRHYFTVYRWESEAAFHYGFDQAVTIAEQEKSHYSRVIVDAGRESALMAHLFTQAVDPKTIQQNKGLTTVKINEELSGVRFDNIYYLGPGERNWFNIFSNDQKSSTHEKKTLVIAAASQIRLSEDQVRERFPDNAELIKVIYYPDTLPAFFVFNFDTPSN